MKTKKSLNFKPQLQIIKGNKLGNDKMHSGVFINVMYKNYDKIIYDEMLVYDGLGLISQLGGVISLFLGISIFTLLSEVLDWIGKKL